ncbi:MAG TPA: hypothetical protein VFQ41_26355 [Candidatus Angelobacter sp.]|nr:hypothetical protein [Candidatus Angelobacter sp.]
MQLQGWAYFLVNWFGLPALALLAILLVYRRWKRVFPLFLVYVVGAELIGITRLVSLSAPARLYARIYWISDAIFASLALLATYELFFKRLFPAFYRVRLYRTLFPAAAILITGGAVLGALFGGHFSVLAKTIHFYLFLRSAVLFFFVVLMLIMGRQWTRQEFGIAFGFGLDVSTALLLLGTWAHNISRGSAASAAWFVVPYDIACIIWIYCFWRAPKTEPAAPSAPLSTGTLHEAKKWEESLKDYISPGKR